MEKSALKQQYKIFGYIAFALIIIFMGMILFRSVYNDSSLKSARFYKKEIKNGVDGLSDKELWVERSTNEIDDIRKQSKKLEEQNARLQKQLDSVQKLVIGLGVHLHAFDDQQDDDKTDSIPSKDIPEYEKYKKENPYISKENTRDVQSPIDKLENFVEQKGILENDYSKNQQFPLEPTTKKNRVLGNKIRVIRFTNANNEYDLDENFIFAGTYARAILMGSVTVSAGIGAPSNPKPVLLRITDMGNLPNKVRGFLKDAIVIGAAYGNLSSESVVIRLERIIKIDKKSNVGMDIAVKGYVTGENGDSDIRGMVIDRAGAVARSAALSGFLSGMAEYISVSNSSAVKFEPNSGLAQFSPQQGSKMLQQGASKGIGNAVEKYADFIIKRAEQMQPVIKIDGGRKVTIVFTESVKASAVNMKKVRRKLYVRKQY